MVEKEKEVRKYRGKEVCSEFKGLVSNFGGKTDQGEREVE